MQKTLNEKMVVFFLFFGFFLVFLINNELSQGLTLLKNKQQ